MNKNKDILGSLILILIFLIISALIFYIFFYSNSKPDSASKDQRQDQEISPPMEDTKYKGKTVYITEQRVKIRSKPEYNATALGEKNKGDELIVTGASGDWFEVGFDFEKRGWVLREQVSDRKPPSKKPDISPPITEKQDNTLAIDQIRIDMDSLVQFINQRSLQQFSQEMVTGFEIVENGAKLVVYVSKTWYFLPPYQKQLMVNIVAMQYGKQCCQYKLRAKCDQDDFPTISFLNPDNKEIARISANQPLQVFE
ncbi:SH3 domain-containing protein [bacterium]|nr:SH3 domain-containing protein [bacterium]